MSIRGSATQHAQEPHGARRFAVTRFSCRRALSIGAAALFALAALVGSGCSSGADSGSSTADNSKALEGMTWKATEIVGVTAVLTDKGTEVTAAFAAGELSGSGGVNRYTATYETQPGDEIKISQPASTMMAGPPAAMAQEQAYFAALTKATQYAVASDSLTLTDDGGAVLVRYAVVQPTTLEGTEWDALAYNNGKGGLQSLAASSAITATFGVRREPDRQRKRQPVHHDLHDVGRHDVDRRADRLDEDGGSGGADEAGVGVSGGAAPDRHVHDRRR